MILGLGVLLALLGSSTPVTCNSGVPGEAFIILVGRNQPPASSNLPDLSYAESDAWAMREVAISRMCFRPEQITMLVGDDATPERLRTRLEEIRNRSGVVGRIFVYVSAHGSKDRQILLKTPMSIEALKTQVRTTGATQRMLFLDTCNSASAVKQNTQKGDQNAVELEMEVEEGFFWLAAAKNRAFERAELRSGEITGLFLKWVGQADHLDSRRLCELMKAGHHWSGACETNSAVKGIIIVPKDRPLGRLRVLDGKQWTYVVFPEGSESHAGYPMTAVVKNPKANAPLHSTIAPGRYFLRRHKSKVKECQRSAPFEVRSNELHEVVAEDWFPDPGNCTYIKFGGEIPVRPKLALWVGGGVGNGGLPGLYIAGHLQLGLAYTPRSESTRYSGFAQFTYGIEDESAPRPVTMVDGSLMLAVDPFYTSLYTVGFSGGLEAGGAYTWVERSGLTGLVALRGGAVLHHFAALQPELMVRVGVRVYAATREDEQEIEPWFGVTLSIAYGIEEGTP